MRWIVCLPTLLLCVATCFAAEMPTLTIQLGHLKPIRSCSVSRDGTFVISASDDAVVGWSVPDKAQFWTYKPGLTLGSADISPDGSQVAIATDAGLVVLDARTGGTLPFKGQSETISQAIYSPSGKILAIASSDGISIFNSKSGAVLGTFPASNLRRIAFVGEERLALGRWTSLEIWNFRTRSSSGETPLNGIPVALSGTSDSVVVGTGNGLYCFDAASLKLIGERAGAIQAVAHRSRSEVWASTGRSTLKGSFLSNVWRVVDDVPSSSLDNSANLVFGSTDRSVRVVGSKEVDLEGRARSQLHPVFTNDGKRLITGSYKGDYTIWNLRQGRARIYRGGAWITSSASTGDAFALGLSTGELVVVDAVSGQVIRDLKLFANVAITSLSTTPDGEQILACSEGGDVVAMGWAGNTTVLRQKTSRKIQSSKWLDRDRFVTLSAEGKLCLWSLATQGITASQSIPGGRAVAVSPTTIIATGSDAIHLFDTHSLIRLGTVPLQHPADDLVVDPQRGLAYGSSNGALFCLDIRNQVKRQLKGSVGWMEGLALSPDGTRLVASSSDGLLTAWDTANGVSLCSMASVDEYSRPAWAVVDGAGRYDASNAGNLDSAYWVWRGRKVQLDQLKQDYFDPGLLSKCFGWNTEPKRAPGSVAQVQPSPQVHVSWEGPVAVISTIDLGGGVGEVDLFLNGTWVETRSMPSTRVLRVDLRSPKFAGRLASEGSGAGQGGPSANTFSVAIRNRAGNMQSKSGSKSVPHLDLRRTHSISRMFILAVGCGYPGSTRPLSFPTRDARAMADALGLYARQNNLYTLATVTLLVSDKKNTSKRQILQALKQIITQAQPDDTIIVYLSGHGMSTSGSKGDYLYLCDDAPADFMSADDYLRTTISGDELGNNLRTARAKKKAVILDTCAAGAATQSLLADRGQSSAMVRAFEQLRDRSGLYLLAGCAPSGISYESSNRGHGLLTYSLLEGLAEYPTDEPVGIGQLFEGAEDRVWRLGEETGEELGQRPEVRASEAAQSFPLGVATSIAKASIHLPQPLPIITVEPFVEETQFLDRLSLTQDVQDRLSQVARRLKWVYRKDQRRGAVGIGGRYRYAEGIVQLQVFVVRYELLPTGRVLPEMVGHPVSASGRIEALPKLAEDAIEVVRPEVEKQAEIERRALGSTRP